MGRAKSTPLLVQHTLSNCPSNSTHATYMDILISVCPIHNTFSSCLQHSFNGSTPLILVPYSHSLLFFVSHIILLLNVSKQKSGAYILLSPFLVELWFQPPFSGTPLLFMSSFCPPTTPDDCSLPSYQSRDNSYSMNTHYVFIVPLHDAHSYASLELYVWRVAKWEYPLSIYRSKYIRMNV